MYLKDVEYVLAIAKTQSVSKAAEQLYISQPALSKYISNLERKLGLELFTRVGNRFIPTYAGEHYIHRAKEIAIQKEILYHELTDIVNSNRGRLRISIPMVCGAHILPYVIPKFRQNYPQVEISIIEDHSQSAEQQLLNGDVDIAVIHLPLKDSGLDYMLIRRECLLMVVPSDHPLSNHGVQIAGYKYPWIDISLFKNQDFIVTMPKQRTRQICDEIFIREKLAPNIILSTWNIETAIRLAAESAGISFAPETFTFDLNTRNMPKLFLIGRPIITSDLVVAYRKGTYLSKPTKAFIKILQDTFGGSSPGPAV